MAGNTAGAMKVAAAKLGLPHAVYVERCAAGEQFCSTCRTWKLAQHFYRPGRAICKACWRTPTRTMTRMSDLEVMTLRQLRWVGRMRYMDLCRMFGRGYQTIYAACNGRTRSRLPMPWDINR